MNERTLSNLKAAYTEYLSTLSIGSLRTVGREKGVSKTTLKKKNELIEKIIGVLTGEIPPVERTKRGAPVKDGYVDPKIFDKLDEIKFTYLAELPEDSEENDLLGNNVLTVQDPDAEEVDEREVYKGQLETLNNVSCLLPFNGIETAGERIIVSLPIIQAYNLREGDIIACYAETCQATLVVTEVLSVNGLPVGKGMRPYFEECPVCYPEQRILLGAAEKGTATAKYIDWLVPMGKGQRLLVSAEAKTGKTTLLKDIAAAVSEAHPEIRLMVLLIDQSPETVNEFRKIIPKDDLIYTTYDDDPDKQVFLSNFILKRAKRFAEMGMDVLLLVDSLSALAVAYNETEGAYGAKVYLGGVESKTIHYIRRFFGAARRLENGGSLTMLASTSVGQRNSADDIITLELSRIANAEIVLDEKLALQRYYPAIDVAHSLTKHCDLLLSEEQQELEDNIRNYYLPVIGNEEFAKIVRRSESFEQMYEEVSAAAEKKKSC